VQLSAKGY